MTRRHIARCSTNALLHAHIVDDAGVPAWWPVFCLAYDVTAALYLAILLGRSTVPARFRH